MSPRKQLGLKSHYALAGEWEGVDLGWRGRQVHLHAGSYSSPLSLKSSDIQSPLRPQPWLAIYHTWHCRWCPLNHTAQDLGQTSRQDAHWTLSCPQGLFFISISCPMLDGGLVYDILLITVMVNAYLDVVAFMKHTWLSKEPSWKRTVLV